MVVGSGVALGSPVTVGVMVGGSVGVLDGNGVLVGIGEAVYVAVGVADGVAVGGCVAVWFEMRRLRTDAIVLPPSLVKTRNRS